MKVKRFRGIKNAEINSLPPGAIPHNTPPFPGSNPQSKDSNLNPPFPRSDDGLGDLTKSNPFPDDSSQSIDGSHTGKSCGANAPDFTPPDYFDSSNDEHSLPEVVIDKTKYPESAEHIQDAIDNGHPQELTINRSSAKQNRKEALKGHPNTPGKDRDEFPPAMFKEGGTGASVRPINPGDNRGAGSSMGHQVRPYPDGTKVRIIVK